MLSIPYQELSEDKDMAHWLVTGGAGFIGSAFVRKVLRETEHNIVVVDKLTYASRLDSIPLDSNRLAFARMDIAQKASLEDVFQRYEFDAIIHFAAESHVDNSISVPEEFIETNVVGTYQLLEMAHRHWQNQYAGRCFMHISTDEVYGSVSPDEPASEKSLYCPSNPYSASKAASDHLVSAWGKTFSIPYIITHSSNNYGPWQHWEKLLPKVVEKAYLNQPIPLYGDGLQQRDWIHVNDHCRALIMLLKSAPLNETYNISAKEQVTNQEMVQAICKHVDAYLNRAEGTSEALIEHVEDRPGHDRYYDMNTKKIETAVGWKPEHNLATSLKDVVSWYCDRMNEKHYVRAVS